MTQRSVITLVEDLSEAASTLADYEDDIPRGTRSLIRFEAALKTLEEIAQEAQDIAAERCEECEQNPCVCEPAEDDEG